MAYVRPDAAQRICEEVERTAWASDREFFNDHPRRSHRLRPAMDAEVSEHEIATGEVLSCPPGMQIVTAVKQLGPGVRARLLFVAPAVASWVDPPEDVCRTWYDLVFDPRFAETEQALATLNLTRAGGQAK
jgi:hypothetical protein